MSPSMKPRSIASFSLPPQPPKEMERIVGTRCGMAAVIQRMAEQDAAGGGAVSLASSMQPSCADPCTVSGKIRVPRESNGATDSKPRKSPSERPTEASRDPEDAFALRLRGSTYEPRSVGSQPGKSRMRSHCVKECHSTLTRARNASIGSDCSGHAKPPLGRALKATAAGRPPPSSMGISTDQSRRTAASPYVRLHHHEIGNTESESVLVASLLATALPASDPASGSTLCWSRRTLWSSRLRKPSIGGGGGGGKGGEGGGGEGARPGGNGGAGGAQAPRLYAAHVAGQRSPIEPLGVRGSKDPGCSSQKSLRR